MHVDLHLHTTASDGRLTPSELVALVVRQDVRIFAITDHDSTEGIEEARRALAAADGGGGERRLIPGIELNTETADAEVHILGHFINYEDESFQRRLEAFRAGRETRGRRMVERLGELGRPIEWSRVRELAQGAIGRPHVATALVERGHVADIQEAFDRYLSFGGPAYIPRTKLSPTGAVEFVRSFGGLPTLAHPAGLPGLEDALLPALVAAGLVGMEVHYKGYAADLVEQLAHLAQRHGIIPLGGTDYHALGREDEVLPGTVDVPEASAERLFALARERGGRIL